ncbi:MAG TPA: flagellar protein FliL [Ghiorsea sp.]|nr:flagellar protein FliL [Ghiorsea sp.]HIP06664.1 flagellar protein FliL [Mariprofundaceae bacterium]
MADEKEGEGVAKSSGGLLPIITIVLLVVLIGIAGFIAWKMMAMEQISTPQEQAQTEGKVADTEIPEAEDEDPDAPPIYLDIADITINLADADVSRFLRAKIKLELRNEASQARVEQQMIKINDMVLTLLSSKTFAEIRTPQGKYDLKEDIVYRINRLVGGKPVKNMFFTDFVSQ